jgi:hypothetical protein
MEQKYNARRAKCTCEFERERMDNEHAFALNKITREEFELKDEEIRERKSRDRYLLPFAGRTKISRDELTPLIIFKQQITIMH